MRSLATLLMLAMSLACPRSTAVAADDFAPLFDFVADIPLGESTSRFDYGSLDPTAGRLYVAKMGSGKLLAFDIAPSKLAAELDGFPTVTGVLAVPEVHKVYASVPGAGLAATISMALGIAGLSSGSGAVVILSTSDLHAIARLPGGVFPDGIAYDPKERRIFVSDEHGDAVLVVDADADTLMARIEVAGDVGNVQYDPVSAKIYAAIQSKDELAVIDPMNLSVLRYYALEGCKHPHGLAIAPRSAIGYAACDGNDRLLTVDLGTGKLLARLPVGRDPDVMAIDAGTDRLYVASESGMLSGFDIGDRAAPVPLGDVMVGPNAHAFVIDPATHRLYFPLADVGGRSVMRVVVPKP